MNISTLAAVLPVAKLVGQSARGLVELGAKYLTASPHAGVGRQDTSNVDERTLEFASQLALSASQVDRRQSIDSNSVSSRNRLDSLLLPLQKWLAELGVDSQTTIELKTDGVSSMEIVADPYLKPAIEDWIESNPEWTQAWQKAAAQYLSESSSSFPVVNNRWGISTGKPLLNSSIRVTSSEYRQIL